MLALCALTTLVGCRNSGGGLFSRRENPDGNLMSRGDPLLGGTRIPPQNLPLPGQEGYGARGARDPLLGSPASRDDEDGQAKQPRPNGSALRRPTKDQPFRPGPETTPAALAGHLVPDDTLSIGDRRPRGQTASQPRDDGPDFVRLEDEFKRLGATLSEPAQVSGGYEVRATVPMVAAVATEEPDVAANSALQPILV